MINYEDNPDGIFVLNGQIFSVNDLISIMRRHGIRIHLNRDGLTIDGEQISSISNLNGNKCPLATACEKRVALVEFLKLQKTQDTRDDSYGYEPPLARPMQEREPLSEYRKEPTRRDFIQPNNHDLFEGNISDSSKLYNEPEKVERPQFDDDDFFDDPRESQFEDSLFQRKEYPQEKEYSREKQVYDYDDYKTEELSNSYCKRCGYDLNSAWNSCPKCGQRVLVEKASNEDYLFK
ncbi:MAG: hypothetical protein KGD59_09110 [Candidatus Heimdallarchaeota archaeon]|nr:hypothetical protein [Candidatus Heimdallarchaeota archaeon]MBY8994695.1 hypothetical protein [Candidatus Heimdallarchaeota archaeon]